MKIIAYYIAYNEITLLPWQFEWCRRQGIEMYVIDNCSNDGTKEFLQQNNIRHHSVDTAGSFDLRILLDEMNRQIHNDQPDWFIYSGMDMFFVYKNGTIADLINKADRLGETSVLLKQYTFFHTTHLSANKEPIGNPFRHTFFYRSDNFNYTFISKYSPQVSIIPDHICFPNAKPVIEPNACIFENQAAKTISKRIETYLRRQKAWDNGLPKNYGQHYIDLVKRNFIYPESEQTDIRQNGELLNLYHKLQTIVLNQPMSHHHHKSPKSL